MARGASQGRSAPVRPDRRPLSLSLSLTHTHTHTHIILAVIGGAVMSGGVGAGKALGGAPSGKTVLQSLAALLLWIQVQAKSGRGKVWWLAVLHRADPEP